MSFTLLILAGGIGSRFNGSKQIEGIGPNKELLLEYSIHDAIRQGCSKIVILSNPECIPKLQLKLNYLTDKVNIVYVNQYEHDPNYPNFRKRPWGTAHAVLSTENYIDENFIIINADDSYGQASYQKAKELVKSINESRYGLVTYHLSETLSEFGGVSRGICSITNSQLVSISEHTNIYMKNRRITSNENQTGLSSNDLVSMNMWVFSTSVFKYLRASFNSFYQINQFDEKAELYLPEVINALLNKSMVSVEIKTTDAEWFGLTYSDDLPRAKKMIIDAIDKETYPINMHSNG
ncbi:MAG: nucleotidyltransferase [Flavobacteriales bacterium]|nr:MAG: nucleotidyltransferase [Flavobacteriales bacterium]